MKEDLIKYFNTFKTSIKLERVNLKLSQKDMAEKIGITTQSYQAYESGLTMPTMENFLKLCKILNITPNELLGFE